MFGKLKRIRIPGWVPGGIISILLIAVLVRSVDLGKVIAAIRGANFLLLGAAGVLAFVWMFLRAIVWRTMLRDRPGLRDTFLTLNEGYLLNNVLPLRLGEVGRAVLLSRKSGLTVVEIATSIIIERAVDIFMSVAILLAALPLVIGAASAWQGASLLGALVALGLVTLYLLAVNRSRALLVFHRISSRWPTIQKHGGGMLDSFLIGLSVLTDIRIFARFMFWMIANWMLAILNYWLIIRAFFPSASWQGAMFVLGVGALGAAVPSLPGSVGTFEGAWRWALPLVFPADPLAPARALGGALTARFFNYLTSFLLGGFALSREGETLSGIYADIVNARIRGQSDDPAL